MCSVNHFSLQNNTIFQGYGKIQSTGGDGSSSQGRYGGAGAGGRIALYFADNKTYAGSFDAFGGLGKSGSANTDGSPGTVFLYHTGSYSTHLTYTVI